MGIMEYNDKLLLLLLLPPRGMAESNTNKESHWRENSKEQTKTRMKSGKEKRKWWHIPTRTQLPNNTGTHKEGEEGNLLFIVVPYPIVYCCCAVPD